MQQPLNEKTLTEAARSIADGSVSSEELVRDCMARIREREETVGAWIHQDEDQVLKQACACDAGPVQGPLHGIPVGIKDILDTCDMPTAYGSPIYDGHRPASDAACVALLKSAGAVILGKTVTTEFAWRKPGKTTNPHDTAYTPGGSSSGSAAAVADFMVPLAIGSQTGGSVIRPASFCGVVGFKPTYGQLSMAGVKPLSHSLDTLGCFVRSARDLELFRNAIWDIPAHGSSPEHPPRISFCRTPDWGNAGPATRKALERVKETWSRAGVKIKEVELPGEFATLGEAHKAVMIYEARQNLQYELREHEALLSDRLKAHFDPENPFTYDQYREALEKAEACRLTIRELFGEHDVFLAPSAPDEAPHGLDFTGDTVFNRMWTLLHLPTISIPAIIGPNGLPSGVQLIGADGNDDTLIRHAVWLESRLRENSSS